MNSMRINRIVEKKLDEYKTDFLINIQFGYPYIYLTYKPISIDDKRILDLILSDYGAYEIRELKNGLIQLILKYDIKPRDKRSFSTTTGKMKKRIFYYRKDFRNDIPIKKKRY